MHTYFDKTQGSNSRAAANRSAVMDGRDRTAAAHAGVGTVVQGYFKSGLKKMSQKKVESEIKKAGLTKEGSDFILKRHGHSKAYVLSKSIATAITVWGTETGKSPKLDTYGELVRIKSSKMRHARRVMGQKGGTRNFANQKLVHKTTKKPIYLGSLSMGLGVPQLELPNETATVSGGAKRKRSHSEALLSAAHRAGKIKDQDGNLIDLNEYEPAYFVSTNEFCQDAKGQQDCHGHLAAGLTKNKTVPAYVANPYGDSDDAGTFESSLSLHNSLKGKDGYDSEPDSEDDSKVPFYLVEDQKLQSKTVAVGDEIDVFKEPPRKKRKTTAS